MSGSMLRSEDQGVPPEWPLVVRIYSLGVFRYAPPMFQTARWLKLAGLKSRKALDSGVYRSFSNIQSSK